MFGVHVLGVHMLGVHMLGANNISMKAYGKCAPVRRYLDYVLSKVSTIS